MFIAVDEQNNKVSIREAENGKIKAQPYFQRRVS